MKDIISNVPPQVIINVLLVLAYVWLLYRVARDRHIVFALARHTFVDAVRKKVLYVLVIFAVILIMWSAASTSLFVQEKVKWVESQSIRLSSFFSMIAVIFLAAVSLPKDISDKTIYTIATKPVRRSDILLGRILGFVGIAAVMVLVMGTISYGFVWLTAERAARETGGQRTQFLTANRTIHPSRFSIEGPGVERRRGVTWVYKGPLFSAGSDLQNDLEKGALSEGSMKMFEEHDTSLSDKSKIITVKGGSQWQIGNTYTVLKENGALNVYYKEGVGVLWRIRGLEAFQNFNAAKPVLLIQLPVRSEDGESAIDVRVDFIGFDEEVMKRNDRLLTSIVKLRNDVPLQMPLGPQAVLDSQSALGEKTLEVDARGPREVLVRLSVVNSGDGLGFKSESEETKIKGVWIEGEERIPPGEPGAGELREVKLTSEEPSLMARDSMSPRGRHTWFSSSSRHRPTWHLSGLSSLVKNNSVEEISCQVKTRVSLESQLDEIDAVVTVNPGSESEFKQTKKLQIDDKRIGALGFGIDKNLVDKEGNVALSIHTTMENTWIGAAQDQLMVFGIPGSFEANFFKAFLIIFFQLTLIISVSIMASTFLSAPVSILLAVFFYFCGHVIDFMENFGKFVESSGLADAHQHEGASADFLGTLVHEGRAVLEGILGNCARVLPDFRQFAVTDDIVSNTYISFQAVGHSCAYMALYVMLAFIIAHLIFSIKEIQ